MLIRARQFVPGNDLMVSGQRSEFNPSCASGLDTLFTPPRGINELSGRRLQKILGEGEVALMD